MRLRIDLSNIENEINPSFFPYLTNKKKFLVLYGGAGSGKSIFIGQKILIRIFIGMDTDIIHKVLCLRKTQPANRKSVFAMLKGLLKGWDLLDDDFVKINQSDMSFTFYNGSQIICAGLDDPEKLKSIYGITSIWMEEANECTLEDFRQVVLRLRGYFPSYKQIMLSFNPMSKMLWLYNEFFENKKVNAEIMHSTYHDNIKLMEVDPDYADELESYKGIDETYYNIFTLGNWGQLLESVYQNYEIIDNFPDENFFKDSAYGLDVGFNVPSALSFVGYHDGEYFIKELLYEPKLTHGQLITKLGNIIPLKHRRSRFIYVDSAEPELIKELNMSGFVAKKSDKSVKSGIDHIKRNKLYIDKESVNLCKEISGYSYRKNNKGEVLEEPIKLFDHLCDAFRYPIYTHWGKIRPHGRIIYV